MASETPKTKSKSASTGSMSAAAKAAGAPAPKAAAPASVVESPKPVVLGPVMRKPELIDAVVAKSGMKKKDVKPVVEAMLAILGSALQDSRELNLQPLGKVKVNREKKMPNGKVLIARIRQSQDLPSEEAHPDPKDLDDDVVTPTAAE